MSRLTWKEIDKIDRETPKTFAIFKTVRDLSDFRGNIPKGTEFLMTEIGNDSTWNRCLEGNFKGSFGRCIAHANELKFVEYRTVKPGGWL